MNFQLSNLFQNQNSMSGVGANVGGAGTRVPVTGQQTTGNLQNVTMGGRPVSDFAPGSSLTGQVVETKDGTVTIQLADSSMVSASLKGGILLEAGSQVTFLVNSNHDNQIILSPLFTNLDASPNVENALKAADIPMNPQTMEMVGHMMEQGMSIDKDSLLAMYKEVANHPEIDSGMVVRLTQMHLAVNELNASQLESYENLNHQLSGSIMEIADSLQQAFASMESKNADGMLRLFDGLMDILQPSGAMEKETLMAGTMENAIQGAGTDQSTMQETLSRSANGQGISELLNPKEFQGLIDGLKNAGGDEAVINAVAKGDISSKDALRLINDLIQGKASVTVKGESIIIQEQGTPAVWKELMSNPAVGKLLKDVLQRNWLLEPLEVADKEKVDAFFEQLRSQTGKLSDLTSSILGKDAAVSQSVNQLSRNIDFLNQLNQTFTYVQIPLKMSKQNANGDLYVYTNKKNLASKSGSVSAFLHLDMDHLGSVDVYVTMEKQRVSTNFKVQDDATLDLIEENIDLLNERLQKRGYQLHAAVVKQEEETSVVEEMQKQMGQNSMPIAQYSFDARA